MHGVRRRSRIGIRGGAALLAAVLLGLTTTSGEHAGASDTQEWFKPGVPHSYSFADPSLAAFGPMTWAYATNTGGADLPAMWSPNNRRYVARVEGAGSAAYIDDPGGYGNDAFPNVPWGVDFNTCDASSSGCDPKELWAPSIGFIGTQWVAYHSVMVSKPNAGAGIPYGRFCIYVARSTSPMGPFTSASSKPIVCPSASTDPAGAIDPEVFVDEETGKAYLIWKNEGNRSGNLQKFWSRQLNSTGTGFASGTVSKVILSNSPGTWEGTVMENPSMTFLNGAYVLLYSGNNWTSNSYATGYAVCSGPLGPCKKPSTTPLLASVSGAWGPGGADGLADQRGRLIAMYHAWNSTDASKRRRVPHTAELSVTGTGQNARVSVTRRDIDPGAATDSLWTIGPDITVTATDKPVSGTYTPAAGDFDGDGHDDIYWYGLWDAADAWWFGTDTPGSFRSGASDQAGAFVPVAGDFDGNGRSDLFWYQPGTDPRVSSRSTSGGNVEANSRPDQLWLSDEAGGWTSRDLGVTAAAIPLAGDFDGDGDTDIIWFQPGDGADTLWRFDRGEPTSVPLRIQGSYRPIIGDFDGNGADDLFWYGPGAKADYIWWYDTDGTYTSVPTKVSNKDYRPFAANLDADAADELFWYTPGSGPDYVWTSIDATGKQVSRPITASLFATPVAGDYDGDGDDDIFWYR
jgi:hypothetical protein